jgi:hypothetical protein
MTDYVAATQSPPQSGHHHVPPQSGHHHDFVKKFIRDVQKITNQIPAVGLPSDVDSARQERGRSRWRRGGGGWRSA